MNYLDIEIIVWNGIIGKYGTLKFYIEENDSLRMANGGEIVQYFNTLNETF